MTKRMTALTLLIGNVKIRKVKRKNKPLFFPLWGIKNSIKRRLIRSLFTTLNRQKIESETQKLIEPLAYVIDIDLTNGKIKLNGGIK